MSVKIDGDIGVIPIGNASGVAFTPVGGIAATNVQAAIQELDAETQAGLATKVSKSGDTMTGSLVVNNYIAAQRNGAAILAKRGTAGTGDIYVAFQNSAGAPLGSVGCTSIASNDMFLVANAGNCMVAGGDRFTPNADNIMYLGDASHRWIGVYAVAGTINTSDARMKTPVRPFTENELSAAKALAKEIGFYKWLQTEKGAGVRDHCGLTVQRVIEVMEANGLTAFDYGFVCYDQNPEREELVVGPEGNSMRTVPANDTYSLRIDELHYFILRGMEERLAALESKQ